MAVVKRQKNAFSFHGEFLVPGSPRWKASGSNRYDLWLPKVTTKSVRYDFLFQIIIRGAIRCQHLEQNIATE
jgi:hypothetical protein